MRKSCREGRESEGGNSVLFSRFYIESISFLKDKTTVELFFLNAKSCVHKVRALFVTDSSGAGLRGSNGRAFVFTFKWREKDIIFFFSSSHFSSFTMFHTDILFCMLLFFN